MFYIHIKTELVGNNVVTIIIWFPSDHCTVTVKRKCFSTEKNRTISATATQAVVCLSCDAVFVNQTFDYTNRSVIERSGRRSTVFDWQNFLVSSIMLDWVRQPNDWYSIGFDCRTVGLDRSGFPDRVFLKHKTNMIVPHATSLTL